MDYGTHAVTSTWFLLGFDMELAEVRSMGVRIQQPTRPIGGRMQRIEIDDDAHFKVRYVDPETGDWRTGIIEATWSWPELGALGSDVRGYIEVQGSTGTVTGFVDEEGRDFLRVADRRFGERLIRVASVTTELESFQAEIRNFVQCLDAGVPSILNAGVGARVMQVLNGAQLSELRGRKPVTPEMLEDFSRELAGEESNVWKGGDRIVLELNKPYRVSS